MAEKLSEKQIDALKEVGTVGAGHAAIALSQLLQEKINIAVVRVQVIPSDDFSKLIGGPDILSTAIYIQMLGDMQGGLALVFEREDALTLIDILLHKSGEKSNIITEIGQSALKEAGNIISGSYLSALSQLIPFKIALSVPRFSLDKVVNLIPGIFEEIMKPEKQCLSLVTEFVESANRIKGYYLFLPKHEALDKILQGLEV
jgi:chemotaxis protein CheC